MGFIAKIITVETKISLQRIKSKPPYYRRSIQDSNLYTDDDKLNLNGGRYYGKYYGTVRGVK